MRRTIAFLLTLVTLLICVPGCGKADRSGEWGAYYQAFRAFTKEFDVDTRYIALDNTGVEEDNREKLYDLFYEFCKDEGMMLIEGDWSILYGKDLLDDAGNFTDGYLVSFNNAVWSEDHSKLTLSVSLRCTTAVSQKNLGGEVIVTKSGESWKAERVNNQTATADKVGAYYAVFTYYADNAGMSGLKDILALDPYGVEEDVLVPLQKLLSSYAARQNYTFMKATWDGLVEKGYVNESGDFQKGYHLSFDNVVWLEEDTCVEITSWMIEGELKGLGGVFTVEYNGEIWEVTNVETMMS